MLVFKTYKEVKPHSYEESKDKVVEGERYIDKNGEFVYYFIMEIASSRSRGRNALFYLHC